MRFIIYGVGAIGGTLAVRLANTGQTVIGIARGAQLEAIRTGGLRLETPLTDEQARFDCVDSPAGIAFLPDDVILLTMKSQDTEPALRALAEAGVSDQPILCVQNGVANERAALRLFANVFGVATMLPADFVAPGHIRSYGAPVFGILDMGRYGAGDGDIVRPAVEALHAAGFMSEILPDIMPNKHGKLLMNLTNILGAALPAGTDIARYEKILRAEGFAVFKAAGIEIVDIGWGDPRRDKMQYKPSGGAVRTGNSSSQSLLRGAGSIETDYLNGEIVLLGRLHGAPTPANAVMCALARELVRTRAMPGSIAPADLDARLRKAGVALPA